VGRGRVLVHEVGERELREIPFFAAAGGEHVAAVAAVPELPRATVLMVGGTSGYQFVGSTFFARLALRLSELGVASVRLDYVGVGDSTGDVKEWSVLEMESVIEQSRSALSAAQAEIGPTPLLTVGMCYGGRVALSFAGDPDCRGVVCLGTPIATFGGWTAMRQRARRWPILSRLRRNALLRRLLVKPTHRVMLERGLAADVLDAFAHAGRVPQLFLYSRSSRDHLTGDTEHAFEASKARLQTDVDDRLSLRFVETGPLTAIDLLRPDEQEAVLELVIDWLELQLAPEPQPELALEPSSASLDRVGRGRRG
jgi:pimeloyl-ACP methyl ester carboxylesterase